MPIPFFLAIYAHDFPALPRLPPKVAWMSAHFSTSGPGMSNLPAKLPPGSLIILDDQTPWAGHSIETVCREMTAVLMRTEAYGLLLDFERPPEEETLLLTNALGQCCRELGIPMGAPESYATDPGIAIFHSPLPCQIPPEVLCPPGRAVWLDVSPTAFLAHIGPDSTTGNLTEDEVSFSDESQIFTDPALHCLYRSQPSDNGIDLLLYHTPQSITAMLETQELPGIQLALGLYRDFIS